MPADRGDFSRDSECFVKLFAYSVRGVSTGNSQRGDESAAQVRLQHDRAIARGAEDTRNPNFTWNASKVQAVQPCVLNWDNTNKNTPEQYSQD
jgi:hypothetical protein